MPPGTTALRFALPSHARFNLECFAHKLTIGINDRIVVRSYLNLKPFDRVHKICFFAYLRRGCKKINAELDIMIFSHNNFKIDKSLLIYLMKFQLWSSQTFKTVLFNFLHSGDLALKTERQSARMSNIKNGSDVKSSTTSWPRGQNFVLVLVFVLKDLSLASALSICPRHVLELFIWALWNCL